MQRDDVRKVVTAQFYQSLSESGVQVSAIPQNQLQAVVNSLADGVFAALAALETSDDTAAPVVAAALAADLSGEDIANIDHPETPIWRGRPYLTIGTIYELTSQRLRIIRGILGNRVEEIELVRLHDTKVNQHLGERMLNVGDVTVVAHDSTTPEIVLHNVENPIEVRELIRKATIDEKRRRGLRYREDIQ